MRGDVFILFTLVVVWVFALGCVTLDMTSIHFVQHAHSLDRLGSGWRVPLLFLPCIECDDRPSWEWRALLQLTSGGCSLYSTFRVSGTMTDRPGSGAHFYNSLLVVVLSTLPSVCRAR